MAKKDTYKEKQYFNDRYVYGLVIFSSVGILFLMVRDLWTSQASAQSLLGYTVLLTLLGGVIWLLRRIKLKITISDEAIQYKLSPMHSKKHVIKWEEVDRCVLVKSPKAVEWMGGNVHFSDESWYSLAGRNGLSLQTKEGRQYFIGCKNINKLSHFLARIGQSNKVANLPDMI